MNKKEGKVVRVYDSVTGQEFDVVINPEYRRTEPLSRAVVRYGDTPDYQRQHSGSEETRRGGWQTPERSRDPSPGKIIGLSFLKTFAVFAVALGADKGMEWVGYHTATSIICNLKGNAVLDMLIDKALPRSDDLCQPPQSSSDAFDVTSLPNLAVSGAIVVYPEEAAALPKLPQENA